jgi:hypothetical protein
VGRGCARSRAVPTGPMTAPGSYGWLTSARTDPGSGSPEGVPSSATTPLALQVFDLLCCSLKINEHIYDNNGQTVMTVARNPDDEE